MCGTRHVFISEVFALVFKLCMATDTACLILSEIRTHFPENTEEILEVGTHKGLFV
jgi:hypothetical protein